jgi:hypothetical protein
MPSSARNRRWVWFFVILAILGIGAIVINLVYNVLQQLRPQELASARALWNEKAPTDYDLDYVVKDENATGSAEPMQLEVERISVHVRGGHVRSATRNGAALPAGEWGHYGVGPLFDLIEIYLEKDGQSGEPPTYTHALFDKKDGHPIHYVRRVMGTRRRLEIRVDLTDPSDAAPEPPLLELG